MCACVCLSHPSESRRATVVQVIDPRSGRKYWCQPATGVSSWTRPEGLASSSSSSDGESGSSGSDSDASHDGDRTDGSGSGSGSSSGSSSDSDDSETGGFGAQATTETAEGRAVLAAVALGWRRVLDPRTGKAYFANRRTGESRYGRVLPLLWCLPCITAGGWLYVAAAAAAVAGKCHGLSRRPYPLDPETPKRGHEL